MKDWIGMDIAILGYGTVGRGVADIVEHKTEGIRVTRILELPDRLTDPRMTSNFDDIVDDPSIELVVECMGGIEPAHTFISRALSAGKHVATSNKAVVAASFPELAALSSAHGASLYIEASVGGGVPWIAGIAKARRIDRIASFMGIMNGTTNYIIDAMSTRGIEFAEALRDAQEKGYAERDPSADIDGIDVANKTVITASVSFGCVCTRSLPVTGIRNLTKGDLEFFAERGRTVKLIGRGTALDGAYAVAVEPVALASSSLEAHVPANNNLVTLVGDTVGELKFYGQGAGMMPTGNAVVQDILDCASGLRRTYDFSSERTFEPVLLASDYVLRTTSAPMQGEALGEHRRLLHGMTAVEARALYERVLESDPSAFIVALA